MYGTRLSLFGQPWWSPFNQLRQEVNRVFDPWVNGHSAAADVRPAVNLWEDADSLQLEAELPGYRLEDLEIYVIGNKQISLKGQRTQQAPEKNVQHRQERVFESFTRVLELPVPVDADKVEANLENGILRLRLAKQEEAKPRKIAVKG